MQENKERSLINENENRPSSDETREKHNPFKEPVADQAEESPQEEAEEEQQRKEAMTERDWQF